MNKLLIKLIFINVLFLHKLFPIISILFLNSKLILHRLQNIKILKNVEDLIVLKLNKRKPLSSKSSATQVLIGMAYIIIFFTFSLFRLYEIGELSTIIQFDKSLVITDKSFIK
jgi:hypothetical protein